MPDVILQSGSLQPRRLTTTGLRRAERLLAPWWSPLWQIEVRYLPGWSDPPGDTPLEGGEPCSRSPNVPTRITRDLSVICGEPGRRCH